ncbi:MAG: VWA domain-containing protein [Terracidiphilus sp.]
MPLPKSFDRFAAAATLLYGALILASVPGNCAAQASVPAAPAQPGPQANTAPTASDHLISIDVDVTDKSGHPIGGLSVADFTVLDNDQPQKLLTFRAVEAHSAPADPLQAIIVVDGINSGFNSVAREREQLGEFLKQNGGELAYPTSIAIITDDGLKVQKGSSRDGNAMFATLNGTDSELRVIGRSQGFYGAADRLERSLGQLGQLAAFEAKQPGRKLVLFISPGWPMLATAGIEADTKQRTWTFNSIVELSNGLREARIALYTLDPFNLGRHNPFYYQNYLKGVTKISQAEYPYLSLQVLSEHSGGQVIVNGNDIEGEINTALRDATAYYTLSFEAAPAGEGTQYHALRVKVDKPGLTVRTTAGYYVSAAAHTVTDPR